MGEKQGQNLFLCAKERIFCDLFLHFSQFLKKFSQKQFIYSYLCGILYSIFNKLTYRKGKTEMLRLNGIKKDYITSSETVNALRGIDISFRKKEFVSILGPSGCGKTTLLNIIGGLDHYTDGDLLIGGRSTLSYTDRDWDVYRNHRIGFIFQSYNLIPHQTILGNVELALTISGVGKEERIAKAKLALDRVGLKGQYYKRPNQLSGGQCQRVAIARALVNDPEILLADEPTGALDTVTSEQIMNLIKEISGERLVIMVTHNPEIADKYSSRIVRLIDGLVVEDTNPFSPEDEAAECSETAARLKEDEENALSALENKKEKKKYEKSKKEKAKMSLFTAFRLSARNLISKKGRTTMVGIAGSIGIIGIAMVLAFSAGIKGYVASMQDDMLSGNPITITETTYDLEALTGMMTNAQKEEIIKEHGKVYISSIIEYLAEMDKDMESIVIQNDITEAYIEYVKAMPEDYYAAMLLGYGLDLSNNIYTNFKENENDSGTKYSISALTSIYTSILSKTEFSDYAGYATSIVPSFEQAINNPDYINSQYDVHGKIATEKNEIMLVLDKDDRLSDILLARLGYYTQDEFLKLVDDAAETNYSQGSKYKEFFTYEELMGKTFTWYPNDTVFEKNTDLMTSMLSAFKYNANAEGFEDDEAVDLKVVGILSPKENISYGSLSTGIYYTEALANYILENSENSDIVAHLNESGDITSMQSGNIKMGLYDTYTYNFKGESFEGTVFVGSQLGIADVMGGMGSGGSGGSTGGMGGSGGGMDMSALSAMKIFTARSAGGVNLANSVSIYPPSFDSKDLVTDYLKKWNSTETVTYINSAGESVTLTQDERMDVTYMDTLSLVIDLINNMIDIVSYALIAFTSISLVVSTVMIGIITYVSVVERVKEIGVIRSLGGRKKDVRHLFNAETFIIGFLAGLFGVGVTYGISLVVNIILKPLIGYSTIAALPLSDAITLIILSIGLTLISGLIPASSAAKQDPVVALRTE